MGVFYLSAKLEFLLASDSLMNWETMIKASDTACFRSIEINHITKINDWKWHEEQAMTSFEEAIVNIRDGKIALFDLYSPLWGPFGGACEPFGPYYLSSFWVDVGSQPKLDSAVVSAKNRAYYDIFYRQFCTLVKQFHISFEFLAIGVETVLEYARTLEDTVAMSRNISAWIISRKYKASLPIRHDRYLHLDDINADLYECSS